MKRQAGIFFTLIGILFLACDAFVYECGLTSTRCSFRKTHLRMTEVDVPSDVEIQPTTNRKTEVIDARDRLLNEAKNLVEKSITGVFLSIPSQRRTLEKYVSQLEVLARTSFTEEDRLACIGDWELVCTSRGPIISSSEEDKDKKNVPMLPFGIPEPPAVADSIRKSISILQRIVSEKDSNTINRVDNVIEYTPLTLQQLIPEQSPLQFIRELNINPLEVSRTKLTLVHNAEVESLVPVFRTKISLKTVTLTVAGTSQFLNTQGAEILGLNVPSLGEFLNSGGFDTTYVDERVRISRGTIGFLNEVRVFVRKGWSADSITSQEF